LGGVIGAAFLAFIKTAIIYQDDKIAAARRWVPLLLAIMIDVRLPPISPMKGVKKHSSRSSMSWAILADRARCAVRLPTAGSLQGRSLRRQSRRPGEPHPVAQKAPPLAADLLGGIVVLRPRRQ
jgi:hypothetical protein